MEANGIVLSPDPRLRQECVVIEEITPAIEALAEKMKKIMFENGGCGLGCSADRRAYSARHHRLRLQRQERLRPVRAHQSRYC